MFADVLNAPVTELSMSDDINAVEDFIDAGTLLCISTVSSGYGMDNYLVFLKAVLEDILNHQASSLA